MTDFALAVIGANFGDEGKGLLTDYLCERYGMEIVARYNGGAQAGHTVVTPEGQRHVFGHFGSGTLLGVPTFLSQFFVCNPILFFKERDDLITKGISPIVFAHPACRVTTFVDIIINQRLEHMRGAGRHGSVGMGMGETVERDKVISITVGDLWNRAPQLESKIAEICDKYARFRTGAPVDEPDMAQAFLAGCEAFAEHVAPLGIGQCRRPVFEGSQGLLLSQDNAAYFPHVTYSYTGARNVRELAHLAGITDLALYYASRTYLTRHGAGPLPGEDGTMRFADDTNTENPWQGRMRFAPLDSGLLARIKSDAQSNTWRLALTHCDQLPVPPDLAAAAVLRSYGPTRKNVRERQPQNMLALAQA